MKTTKARANATKSNPKAVVSFTTLKRLGYRDHWHAKGEDLSSKISDS